MFSKRPLRVAFIAAAAALVLSSLAVAAAPAQRTTAPVQTHPSQGPVSTIPDAMATLLTHDNGVTVTFRTSQLMPGHAHTLWLVLINHPENCATPHACIPADVLGNSGHVGSEVVYAAGHVVGGSGKATFAGHLQAGPVAGGWLGNDFTNPRGAQIQLIVNDHGPVIPGMTSEMIQSYRAGCTDESIPAAFPDTARDDGTPGPNTCRLVQLAILSQQ